MAWALFVLSLVGLAVQSFVIYLVHEQRAKMLAAGLDEGPLALVSQRDLVTAYARLTLTFGDFVIGAAGIFAHPPIVPLGLAALAMLLVWQTVQNFVTYMDVSVRRRLSPP